MLTSRVAASVLLTVKCRAVSLGGKEVAYFVSAAPHPPLIPLSAQPEPSPQQVEGHSLSSTSLAVGYGAKYTHPKERQTDRHAYGGRGHNIPRVPERDSEMHRLNTEWEEETCMPRDAMSMNKCVSYCSHLRERRERKTHTHLIPRLGRDTETLCLSCPRLGDTDNWMKGRECTHPEGKRRWKGWSQRDRFQDGWEGGDILIQAWDVDTGLGGTGKIHTLPEGGRESYTPTSM